MRGCPPSTCLIPTFRPWSGCSQTAVQRVQPAVNTAPFRLRVQSSKRSARNVPLTHLHPCARSPPSLTQWLVAPLIGRRVIGQVIAVGDVARPGRRRFPGQPLRLHGAHDKRRAVRYRAVRYRAVRYRAVRRTEPENSLSPHRDTSQRHSKDGNSRMPSQLCTHKGWGMGHGFKFRNR
jgi:hypothetical protein